MSYENPTDLRHRLSVAVEHMARVAADTQQNFGRGDDREDHDHQHAELDSGSCDLRVEAERFVQEYDHIDAKLSDWLQSRIDGMSFEFDDPEFGFELGSASIGCDQGNYLSLVIPKRSGGEKRDRDASDEYEIPQ